MHTSTHAHTHTHTHTYAHTHTHTHTHTHARTHAHTHTHTHTHRAMSTHIFTCIHPGGSFVTALKTSSDVKYGEKKNILCPSFLGESIDSDQMLHNICRCEKLAMPEEENWKKRSIVNLSPMFAFPSPGRKSLCLVWVRVRS